MPSDDHRHPMTAMPSDAYPFASMNGYREVPSYFDEDGTPWVTIPQEEYANLRTSFEEYCALRNTLLAGGVTVENLQILINTGLAQAQEMDGSGGTGDSEPPPTFQHSDAAEGFGSGDFSRTTKTTVKITRPDESNFPNGKHSHGNGHGTVSSHKHQSNPPRPSTEASQDGGKPKRTLFFTGLPKDATYSDLVDVVRGGALVDVWMKNSDRCASVSFVIPEDAEAYFRHAKRNDIYIKGRRVDVKWREPKRQFVIMRNVWRQIQHEGASRVLVLSNVPHSLTEERLRGDLDHIANLRVERIIRIDGGSGLQCNLNSICAALFARTCLRSRAFYKVCKVEFGTDECSKPLPDPKTGDGKEIRQKPGPPQQRGNRYALFAEDGGEEFGDDSDVDAGSVTTFTPDEDATSIGESSWAESVTAESIGGGADLGTYW